MPVAENRGPSQFEPPIIDSHTFHLFQLHTAMPATEFAAQFLAATDEWDPNDPDHPTTQKVWGGFIGRLHTALIEHRSVHEVHANGSSHVHIDVSPEEIDLLRLDSSAARIGAAFGFGDGAPIAIRVHLHGVAPECKSGQAGEFCTCCPPPDPRGACAQVAIWRSSAKTKKTVVEPPPLVVASQTDNDEPDDDAPDQHTALGDTLTLVLETGRRCQPGGPADWYLARAFQHMYGGRRTEQDIRDAIRDDPALAKFVKRLLEHPTWNDSKRWGVVVEDYATELRRLCDVSDDDEELPDSPDRLGDALFMVLHRGVEKPDFPSDPYFARAYQRCFGSLSEAEIHKAIETDHAFAHFVRRMLDKLDPPPKPAGTGDVHDDCISNLVWQTNKTITKDGTREMQQSWKDYLGCLNMTEDEFWPLFHGWTTFEQYVDRVMKQHIRENNDGDVLAFLEDMGTCHDRVKPLCERGAWKGLTSDMVDSWAETQVHPAPTAAENEPEPEQYRKASELTCPSPAEAHASPPSEPSSSELPPPPTTPRLCQTPAEPEKTRQRLSPSPPLWPWPFRNSQPDISLPGGTVNLGQNAH